ncbi:MAG: site-specific integrase [Mariprofundaceae bacterium]|nr:site-specific integrase [Mariprofundaceae bacterium]
MRDSLSRYIGSTKRTLAPSTIREYESSQRMIIKAIGDKLVKNVTTLEIREWMNSLTCSNKRINNMIVPLRGMFKDLYADGVIDRDPMDRIKNLTVMKHEPEPFEQDELSRIAEHLPDCIANMIKFAAWTGLRTGELFAVTWQDIDFQRKTCRINKSITRGELKLSPKTSAGMRDVELLPYAMDALMSQKPYSFDKHLNIWVQESGDAFTDDKQLRERVWLKALEKAGVRYRTPYQLRHTFASTVLSAGANPMWVANQMGHADWGMIRKVYGKWIPQEHSEVDRMAKQLGQSS